MSSHLNPDTRYDSRSLGRMKVKLRDTEGLGGALENVNLFPLQYFFHGGKN